MTKHSVTEGGKMEERKWTQDEIDADMGLDDLAAGDDFEADCHMYPDGLCGAAGTEYCDFECPFREEADRIRAKHLATKEQG